MRAATFVSSRLLRLLSLAALGAVLVAIVAPGRLGGYPQWLVAFATGQWGHSLRIREPVGDALAGAASISAALVGLGIVGAALTIVPLAALQPRLGPPAATYPWLAPVVSGETQNAYSRPFWRRKRKRTTLPARADRSFARRQVTRRRVLSAWILGHSPTA